MSKDEILNQALEPCQLIICKFKGGEKDEHKGQAWLFLYNFLEKEFDRKSMSDYSIEKCVGYCCVSMMNNLRDEYRRDKNKPLDNISDYISFEEQVADEVVSKLSILEECLKENDIQHEAIEMLNRVYNCVKREEESLKRTGKKVKYIKAYMKRQKTDQDKKLFEDMYYQVKEGLFDKIVKDFEEKDIF